MVPPLNNLQAIGNGHEFGQTSEDGGGGLVGCSPWGHKESHNWVTEQQCNAS